MNPAYNPFEHLPFGTYVELLGLAWATYKLYRHRRGTSNVTRGSAAWLKVWGAERAGMFRRKGLLLGDWSWWSGMLPVFFNGESNILLIGPPGKKKGVGVLTPNALRADFLFLVDPGGEISAICAKQWRRKGFAMHLINPWGIHV